MRDFFIALAIFVLAFFLRVLWLDSLPVGVTGDEIQQGYTAYSILQTGKDEWGDILPINPRSFGDYKPALFSYLIVPSVAIFGLDIFSIRLVSVLFSSLSVVVLFFLGKELFKDRRVGIWAGIFFAITFWHIHASRIGWESNIGVFFFLMGVLLLLKSFKNNFLLIGSAAFFGLGMYSYHSFKLLTILFLLVVLFIYRKGLLKFNRKSLVIAGVVFGIFFVGTIYGILFSGAGRRAEDAAIYNVENILSLRDVQVSDKLPQPWNRVVNNKITYIGYQFVQNYLGYFSTTFYFSPHRSDSSLFNLPGWWLFTIWELPLILVGLFIMIRKGGEWLKIILPILLLAPIPAALTRDYMLLQRVEMLLVVFPLVTAFGLVSVLNSLKNRKINTAFLVGFVVVVSWIFITQVDKYLYHTFDRDLGGLKYGYKEAIEYTEQNKDKYQRVLFTKVHSEPQAFVAFYAKVDPIEYQKDSKNWVYFEKEGFKFLDMINYSLGKYQFRNINWEKDQLIPNTLIVASEKELPPEAKHIKVIKDINGKVIFRIISTDETAK